MATQETQSLRYSAAITFLSMIAVATQSLACAFIPEETDLSGALEPWSGTIVRDGVASTFRGHDPISSSTSFGAGPVAAGYLGVQDTGNGDQLFVVVALEFERVQLLLGERPTQVEIKDLFLRDEYGIGLSYIEKTVGDGGEQVYRHAYREGHGGTTTGTLFIDDTDWDTYLHGRLEATLNNPADGERTLDLELSWIGPK